MQLNNRNQLAAAPGEYPSSSIQFQQGSTEMWDPRLPLSDEQRVQFLQSLGYIPLTQQQLQFQQQFSASGQLPCHVMGPGTGSAKMMATSTTHVSAKTAARSENLTPGQSQYEIDLAAPGLISYTHSSVSTDTRSSSFTPVEDLNIRTSTMSMSSSTTLSERGPVK